jgi:hypothetical protein
VNRLPPEEEEDEEKQKDDVRRGGREMEAATAKAAGVGAETTFVAMGRSERRVKRLQQSREGSFTSPRVYKTRGD